VLLGAALFTVVMNMKHIFVYMAPVYFVYILKNYCFHSPPQPPPLSASASPSTTPELRRRSQRTLARPVAGRDDTESDTDGSCTDDDEWYASEKPRFSPLRFVQVGLVVIAVVAISLGPFVYLHQVSRAASCLCVCACT
jgi:alpha-1,3-glucosyltransferase